jgi:hypothetical protein
MSITRKAELEHVGRCGARAGSVLRGTTLHNAGLRLRVIQEQGRGAQGPIRGPFVILDAGTNMHSRSLAGLLGAVTDSGELLRAIRAGHPSCLSVVNTHLLVLEDPADRAGSTRGAARRPRTLPDEADAGKPSAWGREGVVSDPDC